MRAIAFSSSPMIALHGPPRWKIGKPRSKTPARTSLALPDRPIAIRDEAAITTGGKTMPERNQRTNRVLSLPSDNDYQRLRPPLSPILLGHRKSLYEASRPIEHIYF